MKCKETKDQVAQLKTTLDPEEKSKMIQTIRLRICGEPSDRSICCNLDKSKILENFKLLINKKIRTWHTCPTEFKYPTEHSLVPDTHLSFTQTLP